MTNPNPLPDSLVQADAPYEVLSAALGGVLGAIDELNDYLERVVHAVREHVTGCDEVGITMLVNNRPHTAAYTTVGTLEIDAVQYAVDEGPCLDAARRMVEHRVNLPEAHERWPRFAAEVRQDSVQSLMALPLVSGQRSVGALNLYGNEPYAFDDFEASLARVAASRAADSIVAVTELDGIQRLAGQLEQAMASRAVIEQAKGVIMALRGIDEHEAFNFLRQLSQDRNIKVRVLAEQVVLSVHQTQGATGNGAPTE